MNFTKEKVVLEVVEAQTIVQRDRYTLKLHSEIDLR